MASSDDVLMRGMAGFRKEVGQPLKVPVEPGQYDSSVSDRYNEIREESVSPEYRGFTIPAGMEQDESDRWFAAIDVREDERERKESEPYLTRKPEPWEGQFLEQVKALSLAASQEEQRFLRDPETRGEAYKKFAGEVYEDVMAGDPETIRNVADVSSLVDITGTSDVTSAVQSGRLAYREPEQRGSHLTDVAISGVAGSIQLAATALGAAPLVGNLLSGARLKAAMKADAASLSKAEEAIEAKDPVFESALEKAAVEKIQNKTGLDAVISTLRSGGATKSEIADTKVAEFVEQAKAAGKKSITKDELIKHLDDNKVQIDEVRLSNESQKIPKDVARQLDDLNTKATEAFNDLYDDSKAVARILAPGEDVTDQMHRFSDNSTHFTKLYADYVGGINVVAIVDDVPDDMVEIVQRLKNLSLNRPVSSWTPEDAALITEARNAVNAKLADPEYKASLDPKNMDLEGLLELRPDGRLDFASWFSEARGGKRQREEYVEKYRRAQQIRSQVDQNIRKRENLDDIGRVLNEMPEAETRLAALRKFQASPKYQEYLRSQKEYKETYDAWSKGRKDLSPRWENYTAPAGDNYQEILLTVADTPKKLRLQAEYKRISDEMVDLALEQDMSLRSSDPMTPEMAALSEQRNLIYEELERVEQKPFTDSHHRDISNVLVHIRTKDRIDDRGRKVLFVEEIQSDWHQVGRKEGYESQRKPTYYEVTQPGVETQRFENIKDAEDYTRQARKKESEIRERVIEEGEWYLPDETSVFMEKIEDKRILPPDAPLKDTKEWTALAIRRIFREAADGGYDGVAFSRADMITPLVTLPSDEAIDLIGKPEAFLQRLENLKQRGGDLAEGAEQAEKVFKGNQYFYDTLIPSIAKKESKGDAGTTLIELKDVGFSEVKERHTPGMSYPMFDQQVERLVDRGEVIEVPFFELTDKVRDRVIKPQKLYSVALPGIAVGAAAAEEEELSAAAALGALGMGGMALYKGAKAARVADLKVPTETSAYEGQQTVGKVVFDSKDGMGAVSNSKNVAYKGFVVWMKPQDFLGLNPVRSSESAADTVKAVTEAIEEGKPIGPPFLNVKLVKDGDDAGSFQVVQHEGRGRMAAINSIQPDVAVPVHVFGRGAIDRGRDITPEMMQGLVDPTSNVRLLPDKKATDGKAVTPDAAWHVPDSDDYDPNYLPVGKTYRADAPKPPAATTTAKASQRTFTAPTKLPETPDEIEAAFSEMNRIQRGAPESAMDLVQHHNAGAGPAGYLAEHIGDLTARLGHRAYGPVAEKVGKTHGSLLMGFETPPLQDVLSDKSYRKKLLDKGYERYSMMMEGGAPSMTRDEWAKKFDEKLAKYADEHRKVPVYNEVQRLANDAAVALGEQRYVDVRDSLAKLQKYIDEGKDRFTARMSWVEPEFARFPGGEIPPGTAVKTELPDFSAEYKRKKELNDLVSGLMARRKAAERSDALEAALKSTKAKPPAATMKLPDATKDIVKRLDTKPDDFKLTEAELAIVKQQRRDVTDTFMVMGSIQRAGPEDAGQHIRMSLKDFKLSPDPYGQIVEDVGDLTHRMGHFAYDPVRKKVRDSLRGFLDWKGLDSVYSDNVSSNKILRYAFGQAQKHRGYAGSYETFVDTIRVAGQKYADAHRTVPVYNELHRLANDAAIALGEFRFMDARKHLEKLEGYLDEGKDAFTVRASRVEPEFARPGSIPAKPPAATDVATAGAKTEDEAVEAARLWREMGTKSPFFKRWFGKSKVVDEAGEPLVVYHGTDADFDTFDPSKKGIQQILFSTFEVERQGMFFSPDKKAALEYGDKVKPVYLKADNIIDLGDPDQWFSLRDAWADAGYNERWFDSVSHAWEMFDEADGKLFTDFLKKQGYDGVKFEEDILEAGADTIYVVFEPTQIKSVKNPGTFDPTNPSIMKGIGVGAAVPAAAAVRSQRQEEQGNPLSEPPEYESMSYEGGYSQAIDFSETAALVEKMIGLSNEAQDLYTQMGLIEAEYASLNEEDKIGKRGKLLAEWYDDSADKFSEAGRQLNESEYDRYLMGSDTYYDTDPKGIQGYDDVRLFVNTGYSGDPMLLDADLRASQENKQRKRLKETIGNGGPMLDMFGKSGDLNRYLYQKAKFFEHPVQTVQLNNDQKRILAKDYYNLEALKETGLISYLLYKELLGNVELV